MDKIDFTLELMDRVAIDLLYSRLNDHLSQAEQAQIEMNVVGASGLQIRIDGPRCVSSIGVWPNGCCDVEYIFIASEKGKFKHMEFRDTDAAFDAALTEIRLAIERA